MKKIYLLLSLFLLIITGCEKDETITEIEAGMDNFLKTAYDENVFESQLPLNHTIHWENSISGFYEGMNLEIIEIPVSYTSLNPSKARNLITYKIIVTHSIEKKEQGKKYNFYLVQFLHSEKNKKTVSLFDLQDFSGILKILNASKQITQSQFFSRGVLIGNTEQYSEKEYKEQFSNKYVALGCQTVQIEEWIDWYNGYTGEYSHSTLRNVRYERWCPTGGGSGDGGIGGGGGTGGSSGGGGTTYIERTEKKLDLKNNPPEVEPTQILKDPSFENTKAECVYNKLNQNSTSFTEAIKKFDGEFPVSHLKLSVDYNLPDTTNALTNNSADNHILIKINGNTLEDRTKLGLARTLAHEVIHAELYRKVRSVGGQVSINDFPGIYDYYRRHVKNWQHEQMASHYRETIVDILKEFDNNQQSDQFYNDLAWEGLTNTVAWDQLSSTERTTITNSILNYKNTGNKNCN